MPGGLAGQQQLFTRAVRRYARCFGVTAPPVVLTGITTASSLAEIHAAAASAARHGLAGTLSIDAALQRLFATEEAWWQENANSWGLNQPLLVLRAALTTP